MFDMVPSGDNLQEKSNLYFLEEYEKCFTVFHISMYLSHLAKLQREVTPSMKIVKT